MSRPGRNRTYFIISKRARLACLFSAALLLTGMLGCEWIPKKMGNHEEICQDCIERAFNAQQAGNLEQARELLEQSLEAGPNHAETWWNLSEVSIHQDQYEQAAVELKEY